MENFHLIDEIFSNIVIPKDKYLEEIKINVLNALNSLKTKQNEMIAEGTLKRNGSLDYPPEILEKIFENGYTTSETVKEIMTYPINSYHWNFELRSLNQYFYEVYNQYYNFQLEVCDQIESDHIRSEYSHLKVVIEARDFIPIDLSNITILNLSGSYLTDKDIIPLANALKSNTSIKTLNLFGSGTSFAGATALAKCLKVNKTLANLNLSSNNLQDRGAIALAIGLKFNKTLTSLNLSLNCILNKGVLALTKALLTNKTLNVLNLRYNYNTNNTAIMTAINPHKDRIVLITS